MKFTITVFALAAMVIAIPAVAADGSPGQQVYGKTCKGCHEGTGQLTASDLYKVKVPAMDSAYIQQKSDAALKTIIMGGKGKMDPVEFKGRPTQPHRKKLSSEQVDQVIAYIRTLKPKS